MHVQQQQSDTNTAAMMTLVDIAAAVETRLRTAEDGNRALQHELRLTQQRAQSREDQARRWILAIRRAHRSQSHARTSKTIRQALASCESGRPTALSLL